MSVFHRKSRSVGIETRASAIAHREVDVAVARDIHAIDPLLFSRDGCFGRIDFEVLVIFVEARQTQRRRALSQAQRNAVVAQRDDLDRRIRGEAHEIARIDLNLRAGVASRRQRVAFDQRYIQSRGLPIITIMTLQVDVALNKADPHDARVNVILIPFIFVGTRG